MSLEPTPNLILHEDTVAEMRLLFNHAKEHHVHGYDITRRCCVVGYEYGCRHCKATSEKEHEFKHDPGCPLQEALLNIGSFLDMQEEIDRYADTG